MTVGFAAVTLPSLIVSFSCTIIEFVIPFVPQPWIYKIYPSQYSSQYKKTMLVWKIKIELNCYIHKILYKENNIQFYGIRIVMYVCMYVCMYIYVCMYKRKMMIK